MRTPPSAAAGCDAPDAADAGDAADAADAGEAEEAAGAGLLPEDFRLLFEAMPGNAIVLLPDDGFTIVAVSEGYLRTSRRSREELLGQSIFAAFPDNPEDAGATGVRNFRASLEHARDTRSPHTMSVQRYDIPLPAADGGGFSHRYWNATNTPVLASGGQVRFLLHQPEDVTEVVRLTLQGEQARSELRVLVAEAAERQQQLVVEAEAREKAVAERRKLYGVFDEAPVGIAFFRGPRHVIEYANAAECRFWGRPPSEVLGRTVAEALPEAVAQGLIELGCDPVYRTGEPIAFTEVPMRFAPEGAGEPQERFFNFTHVPTRAADGAVEGFMAVAWDVTGAVVARRSAAHLASRLQERIDFEEQLIGIVGHDLRSPLQAILLTAGAMARREGVDARTAQAILRIQSATERAVRLVGDVLDFTRARLSGSIPVSPGPADLHAVVRAVVDEVEAAHPDRRLELQADGDGQGAWDVDRLAQVVENLVTNALKYSPEGTPVRVVTRGEADGVCLTVHNEGPPIPPDTLPHLFEPLQRAASEADNRHRSVGLGLYIARTLVEAHGGTLTVSSTAGEGTAFTARLPRTCPTPAPAPKA
jgi:signal transduction histidine kinase